ncbi:hypothetical protein Y032_0009g509 [Ancylostoma ceylanicum]|uniref:Uncharacterized protein n=1 Tax=Ancylostoma ceylanicum TaxID=53326 RepID=A0A016VJ96_9BILA|nr:hypothetical protein Y032_0009g509 [Ancylostoma ceylanicum]
MRCHADHGGILWPTDARLRRCCAVHNCPIAAVLCGLRPCVRIFDHGCHQDWKSNVSWAASMAEYAHFMEGILCLGTIDDFRLFPNFLRTSEV